MASSTLTILLFYGASTTVLTLLCWVYWKKDHFFQRVYAKRNMTFDSALPVGFTLRKMHRVSAVIFGVMAVLFGLSGVIALLSTFVSNQ